MSDPLPARSIRRSFVLTWRPAHRRCDGVIEGNVRRYGVIRTRHEKVPQWNHESRLFRRDRFCAPLTEKHDSKWVTDLILQTGLEALQKRGAQM